MKIYQQTNSQGFHIGTSAHPSWAPSKGALDVDAPVYDRKTERARWVDGEWVIKSKAEWAEILAPKEDEA